MKFKFLFLFCLAVINIQAQATKKPAAKPAAKAQTTAKVAPKADPNDGIFATISTTKGDIVVSLEYVKAPVTVANFISLAEGKNPNVKVEKLKGKPFYDGLKFHRVINDFMIQGGDPDGNGSGGPGYSFKDEFREELKFDKGGILAMANSGPATNGSQFFITHKETPWLNGKHTIFGHVVSGMDNVNKIVQDDIMTKITITRKGAAAKKFDAVKVLADDAKKDEAKKLEAQKVIKDKVAYFAATKAKATTTASGLKYLVTQKGTGVKGAEGSNIYFHYAGYFEDGTLFDSSMPSVAKAYGKYDANRDAQGGYKAFPFTVGKKDGMIPGFIEALDMMTDGEKAIFFLPSNLAYGEKGAGGVIPPNATLIFEIETYQNQPVK
ncbi:Peptidyl-prolyl cis-trans isomerase (rotamase)-cyclophilin family [Flavobacterium aquidurense]|uniref:peptidylprolyl isomerase n=1 Tax=Flavobacterium frigidimaris TaxID=262320 RepID=A0ABX4BPP4_FLAFR|nr:peptidylprolyl isomerase [Flavobacterium frigidimaris]OXA78221.1 peptidylprolyl isomerase [Flavobacterium frigidimaris]SDY29221.1 Peptidyl-prolyl cis-trans isomerase (rotamase)-cyclophilin family [Flavobacterium aquidurense]